MCYCTVHIKDRVTFVPHCAQNTHTSLQTLSQLLVLTPATAFGRHVLLSQVACASRFPVSYMSHCYVVHQHPCWVSAPVPSHPCFGARCRSESVHRRLLSVAGVTVPQVSRVSAGRSVIRLPCYRSQSILNRIRVIGQYAVLPIHYLVRHCPLQTLMPTGPNKSLGTSACSLVSSVLAGALLPRRCLTRSKTNCVLCDTCLPYSLVTAGLLPHSKALDCALLQCALRGSCLLPEWSHSTQQTLW
jgi:hypothetical protein